MTIFFSIKEGFRGLAKARVAGMVAITSIALSLTLIGLFAMVSSNLNDWIGSVRERIELEVFLDITLDEKKITSIRPALEKISEVDSVRLISKKEAAQRFREEFGQDVFDILDFNPLPASYIVKLKKGALNMSTVTQVIQKISSVSGVDEVVYQRIMLQAIDRYLAYFQLAAAGIGMVIALIAIGLIYNTIRLTIHARRDLVQIMRLVGATESFIRRPFIVEGILQGIAGAAISAGILALLAYLIRRFLYPSLMMDPELFAYMLAGSIFVGMISARLSVGKYLRKVY